MAKNDSKPKIASRTNAKARNDSKVKGSSKGNAEPPRRAPAAAQIRESKPPEKEGSNQGMEALLEFLQRTRGFDFTSYKRASLDRRIQKRMQDVQITSYESYVDYLEVHPEEFAHLFNTILINVTDFFRDPQSWELLRDEVIPRILHNKRPDEPIRVWSAGCASGEEAYSISMLLADALGMDGFRDRAKVYATDADEDALNQARQGSYSPEQVESVPSDLLARHFEVVNGRYIFSKELRRSIIFGRHDLLQDAPISRVDLILCRNTLMYFNAEAQTRILARFGFALNDGGVLFLGKAETLLTRMQEFTPVDMKRRIFSRVPRRSPRERLVFAGEVINGQPANGSENGGLREAAFDSDPLPQIVVDTAGTLALANQPARALFGLTFNDLGRPFQDLEVSFRPVELRSRIQQAYIERRPITVADIEFTSVGGPHIFDLAVFPLFDSVGNAIGAKAVYTDVTRLKQLQVELQQSHQELEAAYEELQSANEELETTNEELQSTVEELETTNEELQSTNEELETMNEELQSTNEELEAANEQLRERTDELNEMNDFNDIILRRMPGGMIVVDRDLKVTAWNRQAEDLWGLRADEVKGKHLLNLDIGLPLDVLKQPIRSILSGDSELEHVRTVATNRRGKSIQLMVTSSPLKRSGQVPQGVIMTMEETKDDGSQQ